MRHRVRSRRFQRSRSERLALVRSLVRALFRYERIVTTLPKAKEAQRTAERLITRAKDGSLDARRRVVAWLQDEGITRAVFSEISPRFHERAGGYTRIVRAGYRQGDGAPMAVLELTERKPEAPPVSRGRKEGPPPPPKAPSSEGPPAGGKPPPPPPKKPWDFFQGLRRFFFGRKDRPQG